MNIRFKHLLSYLSLIPDKPKQLKDFLKTEFKEALIPMDMPNVGTYKPGSRTKF